MEVSAQTCKYCGSTFKPFKNAKGFYCSTRCYFAAKRSKAGQIEKSRIDAIVELYKRGMFLHPIARAVKTDFSTVKKALQDAGLFDPNRVRPQHVKGSRKLSSLVRATRIIATELRRERNVSRRFDETQHWKNHSECKRWTSNRIARSQYFKWRTCPSVLIRRRLRSRVNRVLRGKLKSAPTLTLLGCSLEQFKDHLESQFTHEMNWSNYGAVWHIDHKEPCSSFDLSNPADQRRCFHFSNLQPLAAKQNLSKHARIVPTQRELLINLNERKL